MRGVRDRLAGHPLRLIPPHSRLAAGSIVLSPMYLGIQSLNITIRRWDHYCYSSIGAFPIFDKVTVGFARTRAIALSAPSLTAAVPLAAQK